MRVESVGHAVPARTEHAARDRGDHGVGGEAEQVSQGSQPTALEAEARSEHGSVGEQNRVDAGARDRLRRADHDPEHPPADGSRVLDRDIPRELTGHGAARARDRLLHVTRFGVRGRRQDEKAATVLAREVDRGGRRIETLIGDDGHRVCRERRIGVEPRGTVRGHRRADVATLGVGDDQEALGPRMTDDLLEHRVSGRSEALVEGDLRLDDSHTTLGGIDGAQRELTRTLGRIRQPPLREQRCVRVEPQTQPPVRVDRDPQALAERCHRCARLASA